MIRYYVLIIIIFFGSISYSQNTSKIEEIHKLYNVGQNLIDRKEYKAALDTINLGLKNSKKIDKKSLMARGYFYLGNYYQVKKEHLNAIENYKLSLSFFKDLNNQKEIANCYYKIGRSQFQSSQYNTSLKNYFNSLSIREQLKDEVGIAVIFRSIADVYLLTKDYVKARENLDKSIKIYKKANDELGVLYCITSLGASYQKEGNLVKALEIYKVGLDMARRLKIERNESIFLGNIGSSYRKLGDYKKSLEFLFKALPIKIKQERYTSAAHTYNDISETYIEMNNLVKAKEFAIKAVNMAKSYSLHQERYAYYILSNIEYDLGEYKNSRNSLKEYQNLEDSIFSIDKIRGINELQIKYESEKQQLKIEAQESNIALLDSKNRVKNQFLLFGGIGLLSVFFVIILSKSRNVAKKEKKLQEKFSQDLIMSQEEERTRIARELHDSVGQQLTLIKRKAQNKDDLDIAKMTNNALEEVRSISRNLYPALLKQLGLKESIEQLINEYDEQTDLFFSMDIDLIDEYFTENTSLNFYRLVQECLTNIVKHAKAKSVTVNIKKEDKSIITLISDNGKGFNVDENKKKNSLGLKTIFERIKIMKGKLSIDSKINNGTNFIFSIPIKNES